MNQERNAMTCNRLVRGILVSVAILGLSVTLDGIGVSIFAPQVAQADTETSDLEVKAQWQQRYRQLLQNQARLRDNAKKSRENYARAQRRNYPRGGARQQFIVDAELAEADLVMVEAETEALREEARRSAIPRNWFYEIDDEDIQAPAPAAAAVENTDDGGRNPLYRNN